MWNNLDMLSLGGNMIKDTQTTLNEIAKSISKIETALLKLVEALETITSGKALNEEILDLKKEVRCLKEEYIIFNQK